jgi:hypothetical protein
VVITCLSLLNTDWYTRQLLRRPVYEYDSVHGPAIYRGKAWKKPSGPPLKLTMNQADAVPPLIEMSAAQTFRKEGTEITATIKPRQLGDYTGLERADLFVLYMIRDGYPERPFFFSRTSGAYAEEMGFAPYTLTVGLARKLMPEIPKGGNGVVSLDGEWLDAPTTRVLWETVFKAPASLAKRTMWVDRPSAGIPYLYVRTGLELSATLDQLGLKQEAAKIRAQTVQIARATELEELLGSDSR